MGSVVAALLECEPERMKADKRKMNRRHKRVKQKALHRYLTGKGPDPSLGCRDVQQRTACHKLIIAPSSLETKKNVDIMDEEWAKEAIRAAEENAMEETIDDLTSGMKKLNPSRHNFRMSRRRRSKKKQRRRGRKSRKRRRYRMPTRKSKTS